MASAAFSYPALGILLCLLFNACSLLGIGIRGVAGLYCSFFMGMEPLPNSETMHMAFSTSLYRSLGADALSRVRGEHAGGCADRCVDCLDSGVLFRREGTFSALFVEFMDDCYWGPLLWAVSMALALNCVVAMDFSCELLHWHPYPFPNI